MRSAALAARRCGRMPAGRALLGARLAAAAARAPPQRARGGRGRARAHSAGAVLVQQAVLRRRPVALPQRALALEQREERERAACRPAAHPVTGGLAHGHA